MNDMSRRILADRMRRGDHRRGRDYEGEDHRSDYRGEYRGDHRGHMEYRGEYEHDGRHGYSSGRHHGEVYGEDYRGNVGGGDYAGEMRLSRADMKHWKKMLKNGDGSTGEHFSADQMHEVSRQVGAKFEEYDEADLCMTANMLYSDLCEALRPYIPKDKEAMVYAKMARHWLEDEDGPEGSEKLALYYYCIVEGDG